MGESESSSGALAPSANSSGVHRTVPGPTEPGRCWVLVWVVEFAAKGAWHEPRRLRVRSFWRVSHAISMSYLLRMSVVGAYVCVPLGGALCIGG